MKIIDPGHRYKLRDNKSLSESTELVFFKDSDINGSGYPGTTNQEVIRALIDRVQFLNSQLPHRFNSEIIDCLRRALALHEMRHIERLVERGFSVEAIPAQKSGHFI
jgi:hypothetical protein